MLGCHDSEVHRWPSANSRGHFLISPVCIVAAGIMPGGGPAQVNLPPLP